jgi:hypothetical protein
MIPQRLTRAAAPAEARRSGPYRARMASICARVSSSKPGE